MGLDIDYYEKAERVGDPDQDMADECGLVTLYVVFEAQADGMSSGNYRVSGGDGFAAAYSSYSAWRDDLARLVGSSARAVAANPKPGPFVELINFSDCEGFIGPKTSAKLAADFAKWQRRAAKFAAELREPWWLDLYNKWREAFEVAARGGVVHFH